MSHHTSRSRSNTGTESGARSRRGSREYHDFDATQGGESHDDLQERYNRKSRAFDNLKRKHDELKKNHQEALKSHEDNINRLEEEVKQLNSVKNTSLFLKSFPSFSLLYLCLCLSISISVCMFISVPVYQSLPMVH